MSDLPISTAATTASLSPEDLGSKAFKISPLIRGTLLLFYVALTLPLPTLTSVTAAPVSARVLQIGILMGGVLLYGSLSEQVCVDQTGIRVQYPQWIGWLFGRKWQLEWHDIAALRPRTTGQGGLVYYFVSKNQDNQAYLLPMRIAGFAQLLQYVEFFTDIDTRDVTPLAQPWMYILLLFFSLILLAVDIWILWFAAHFSGVV